MVGGALGPRALSFRENCFIVEMRWGDVIWGEFCEGEGGEAGGDEAGGGALCTARC